MVSRLKHNYDVKDLVPRSEFHNNDIDLIPHLVHIHHDFAFAFVALIRMCSFRNISYEMIKFVYIKNLSHRRKITEI